MPAVLALFAGAALMALVVAWRDRTVERRAQDELRRLSVIDGDLGEEDA